MLKFLTDELFNSKILGRLDENTQLAFNNIEEDIIEKIFPVIENTLILLSSIRGYIKAS